MLLPFRFRTADTCHVHAYVYHNKHEIRVTHVPHSNIFFSPYSRCEILFYRKGMNWNIDCVIWVTIVIVVAKLGTNEARSEALQRETKWDNVNKN